ncbi:MAG: 50S ribosomal protein L11 methyltransferase [Anaerovoracaceae bacterium]
MDYTKVKIFTESNNLEIIASMLQEKGISGVEIEEPQTYSDLLDKQNIFDWDYIDPALEELKEISPSLTFYTDDTPEGIDLLDDVLQEIRIMHIERVEVAGVSDEDWKHKWKEYFKPTRITDRIVVKPSWEPYEKTSEELVIEIDPGMAFGTGTHPTTTLCIKLLGRYISEESPSAVLDIGCGSGILTIAAALLGAHQVLGVDIDPVAVAVAKSNVEANSLTQDIRIIEGDLTKGIDFCGDIIVANLMADLVIHLSKDAAKHLKENGVFISSGIIIEKKQEVASALAASGFRILDILEEGEWCAIAATLQ